MLNPQRAAGPHAMPPSVPLSSEIPDKDTDAAPKPLTFPPAHFFRAALLSNQQHTQADLSRLTAAQLAFEAASIGRTLAMHKHYNPTLASACFFMRASAGAPCASLGLDGGVQPALRLIERAVTWHRAAVGAYDPGGASLEPSDTLAVAILYKLAQFHDFALQPTPNLRAFVQQNLMFEPDLLHEQRRHREAGFVGSALGMPRQSVVSNLSIKSMIPIDYSNYEADEVSSALELEMAGEDWTAAIFESDGMLGELAVHFNLPTPALKALITPNMREDGRPGMLRAVVAAGAVLNPAALGKNLSRAPVEQACAQARKEALSILAALDDGDDVSALPALARAEHNLRLALHKLDIEPGTGFTLIDHTQTLQAIREKAYAVAPDEHAFVQLTLTLLTWQLL